MARQVSQPVPYGLSMDSRSSISRSCTCRRRPAASWWSTPRPWTIKKEIQGIGPDMQTLAITDGNVVGVFSGFQRLSSGIAIIDAGDRRAGRHLAQQRRSPRLRDHSDQARAHETHPVVHALESVNCHSGARRGPRSARAPNDDREIGAKRSWPRRSRGWLHEVRYSRNITETRSPIGKCSGLFSRSTITSITSRSLLSAGSMSIFVAGPSRREQRSQRVPKAVPVRRIDDNFHMLALPGHAVHHAHPPRPERGTCVSQRS